MKLRLMQGLCGFFVAITLSAPAIADTGGVQVSGTAKVSVVPDIARFSFAINGRGKSLPELKLKIDKNTASVITLVKKLGVVSKYISSAEVAIHPQYNHQTRELIGYNLSRNINVELHNLERYTELVNGAIESGITTINNITLDIKDRDKLAAKALAAAVKAAGQKAEIIAQNAGIKLGKIRNIQENGSSFDNRQFGVRQMAMSESAVSEVFEPGEISVMATVLVVYAIQ